MRSTTRPTTRIASWTTEGESTLEFPAAPIASYDLLGRAITAPTLRSVKISKSPAFYVFEKKDVPSNLIPAATNTPSLKKDEPSPIVFQVLAAEGKTSLPLSSIQISANKPETLNVFAYNFGKRTFKGHLTTTFPKGWSVQFPKELEIAPGERKELALTIDCHSGSSSPVETIEIHGTLFITQPSGSTLSAHNKMVSCINSTEPFPVFQPIKLIKN